MTSEQSCRTGTSNPMSSVNEEPEEDEPRVDPRGASHHDVIVLDRRVRLLSSFAHDTNDSPARLANNLEEMHRRVDWFETPSTLQRRVVDLERQIAQLRDQLDLLLCLLRVLWLLAVVQSPPGDPAPAPPRSPEQVPNTA
ncbi:hypothetical protein PC128_g21743 [Phytophthora cactorum]|nr:hypothetical protein PC128_g21743 [Phytophthora cactorum]